jgi:hypothetical protein
MLPNPVAIDPNAAGDNNPKAVTMDPSPNVMPVEDKGGGLAEQTGGLRDWDHRKLMVRPGWLTMQMQPVQQKSLHYRH